MARRGRPPIEDPRDKQYRIRLNDEENERLIRISKDFGMSKSDTVRRLIEEHEKKMKGD